MIFKDISLKKFNTFKIDIKAKKIIIAHQISDFCLAWGISQVKNIPFLVLGKGSNVLFISNYPGIVVINKLKGISITEDKIFWYLHVNSGENWHRLVVLSLKNGFFGLENLAMIPGTVGASIIQNIGAYGIEIQQVFNYVDLLNCKNKKIIRLYSKECKFNYRSSSLNKCCQLGLVVIAVGFILKKQWKPIINYKKLSKLKNNYITPKKIFDTICKIRKQKIPNPKTIGNAGSFFKNPIISKNRYDIVSFYDQNYKSNNNLIKLLAAKLIENCNLKKFSIGAAEVYEKHALIIINKKNNATWQEILSLSQYIRRCVLRKFNILLEPEVEFIFPKKNIFNN